ncbi:hypothetical protein [Streptomyces sp. NBC_00009]|uniref:hypothetical protein n=1 Tax=Streptomyces sp. NBC_00009 TaxID=2975620 RepID=UPI003254BDC7
MRKTLIRSALAVAFSAGMLLSAVSALDLHWGGAPAVDSTSSVSVQAIAPPDLHWGSKAMGAPV